MKLIVQRIDGADYVYFETEKQFKICEKQRLNRIDENLLNHDCALESYPDNCHMVFDIKR